MEQQPLDKTIKESLEKLKVPFNADHWQQMEAILNSLPVGEDTAIDAVFDAQIKRKLASIERPTQPDTWTNIEAGLVQTELADTQFDDAVSQKIGDLETSVGLSWENIEQELTIAEAADAAFDQNIYHSLHQVKPSYQPSHWQRLVTKLNTNLALREKLYRYKLVETTLIILFLLQFYQHIPNITRTQIKNNPSNQVLLERNSTTEASITAALAKNQLFSSEAENNPDITKKQASSSQEKNGLVLANTQSSRLTQKKDTPNADNTNLTPLKEVRANRTVPTIAILGTNTNISQRTGLSIPVREMNQHLTEYTAFDNSLITTVPSLKPNFVTSLYIVPLNCKDCKYSKVSARLRLGITANLAMNNAYISGGDVLDINAWNQRGFGYGSGFTLGFKYGRWEIETGIDYAAKKYDPNIVDLPHPDLKRTHFQSVHFQTLHLPANVRYNYAVLGKGKWHLYAQTGVALNVILRAEYDLAEISAISRSNVNVTTSRLNQIDYNKGLFAGDGFKSNRFLSISMGAGVERYISPSWSVFFQPDFHFHFSGNRIGPTEDRINTLRFSFGARKSL